MKNMTYVMPGEWKEHERTFIEWPVKSSLVYPENYEEVVGGYKDVIKAISEFEPVTVIINPGENHPYLNEISEYAQLLEIPHNDAWCRDNGPTFVYKESKVLTAMNWKFNAWGEKYGSFDLDNKVASLAAKAYEVPVEDVELVLEGGSIHTDGEGTLLTTEECLLNKNRNPHLNREEIETIIKPRLGIEKIIWLKNGLFGDETDGHVDNAACFANPGTVVLQICEDIEDPNYQITQDNKNTLETAVDARGRKLKLVTLPQPPARYYKGERLTLSYINYYMVNGGIVLPVFGESAAGTDKEAERILKETFPDRVIRTVNGMPLIKEGGNVHCITQQMPVRL
jgi:agmatine deiminase